MGQSGTTPQNAAEYRLVQQVALGQPATFAPGHDRPVIRSALIRDLLFSRARLAFGEIASADLAGVQIDGASIDGPLDLSDSAIPFKGLPALELTNCTIRQPLNFTSARLARLSLAGSRFTRLELRDSNIGGPFDFSRAHALDGGECWIDARGALIEGMVLANGAHLKAPAPRPGGPRDTTGYRAALWLAGATIHGSVRLTGDFCALGGVSLDGAHVLGDVRIYDALLTSGESDALNARGARIDGVMYVRRCVLTGVAWLLGLHTGGRLEFSKTTIQGRIDPWDDPEAARRDHNQPHVSRKAMIISDSDIGASVLLTPGFRAYGITDFATTRVRGDFSVQDAWFHNGTSDGTARALNLTNADIGGNLRLDGANTEGRLDMAGTRIGGRLTLAGIHASNLAQPADGPAIEMINASVGGDVQFGGTRGTSSLVGTVDLTGSRIGGDLKLDGSSIGYGWGNNDRRAVVGRQMQVRGNVILGPGFRAWGAVLMSGATIGRHLLCHGAMLFNPSRSALYAKDAEIGDDLKLEDCDVGGNLRLDRLSVTGKVTLQNIRLDGNGSSLVDLTHARIGSQLTINRIKPVVDICIKATGARTATVNLERGKDWVAIKANSRNAVFDLDGFTYERIEVTPCNHDAAYDPVDERRSAASIPAPFRNWSWVSYRFRHWPGPRRDDTSDPLIDWLLLLDGKAMIRPQPFRQLTAVLRTAGEDHAARNVAITERWAVRTRVMPGVNRTSRMAEIIPRGLNNAFGACFGFGLSPLRAWTTFVLYLCIGTLGTWSALHHDLMAETPHLASSYYEMSPEGRPIRAFIVSKGSPDWWHDVPCTDIGGPLDAFVYALDTILPFIPLHQDSKCELRPEYSGLRLLAAIYMVIGWIVTSLTLLTSSGIVKRFDGEGGE